MKGFKGFIFGVSFILNLILGLFTAAFMYVAIADKEVNNALTHRKTEIKSESKEGPVIGFHK